MKKWFRITGFLLLIFITCALGHAIFRLLFVGCVISKDIETYNIMVSWAIQIDKYYKNTGIVISQLDELDNIKGIDFQDSWGKPIIYKKYDDGTVLLATLGSDGKPGGTGKKSDFFMSCDPREKELFSMAGSLIPEATNTRSKMQYLKKKILEYHKIKGALPSNLKELELSHEYLTNDDKDYWGNPLLYHITGNTVQLICDRPEPTKGEMSEPDYFLYFQTPIGN